MEQPLISVIIPVDKVEPYLKRCVDSVRQQTYQNLEIILVDDGSPDRCGEMCDAYAREDSRIKVIHKENGGQSSARNMALDVMTGDYVGFVDSDDWIEPNMFTCLYELVRDHGAQIAVCGVQLNWDNGKTALFNEEYPRCKDIEYWSRIDALRELAINTKITNAPWNKLFERQVFDGLRMRVGSVFEDFEIMPKCMERVDRIVYNPTPMYHYMMTGESTTRGVFQERRFVEASISREIVAHYQENYPELIGYVTARHAEICLVLIHASAEAKEFADQRNALIQEVRGMKKKEFFSFLSRKNKIKYCLFRLHVGLYTWCMSRYYEGKA